VLIPMIALAAACSSGASRETSTSFGRACRALGDAESQVIKQNWARVRRDYAAIRDDAGGIEDEHLRAAAVAVAAHITATASDTDLPRSIGGDVDDELLAARCRRSFGEDF
jgi:hypothetical protein